MVSGFVGQNSLERPGIAELMEHPWLRAEELASTQEIQSILVLVDQEETAGIHNEEIEDSCPITTSVTLCNAHPKAKSEHDLAPLTEIEMDALDPFVVRENCNSREDDSKLEFRSLPGTSTSTQVKSFLTDARKAIVHKIPCPNLEVGITSREKLLSIPHPHMNVKVKVTS